MKQCLKNWKANNMTAIIELKKLEAIKFFESVNRDNVFLGDPEITIDQHIEWLEKEIPTYKEGINRLGMQALLQATELVRLDGIYD